MKAHNKILILLTSFFACSAYSGTMNCEVGIYFADRKLDVKKIIEIPLENPNQNGFSIADYIFSAGLQKDEFGELYQMDTRLDKEMQDPERGKVFQLLNFDSFLLKRTKDYSGGAAIKFAVTDGKLIPYDERGQLTTEARNVLMALFGAHDFVVRHDFPWTINDKFWAQFREDIKNALKTGVLKPNLLLGSGITSAGCQHID